MDWTAYVGVTAGLLGIVTVLAAKVKGLHRFAHRVAGRYVAKHIMPVAVEATSERVKQIVTAELEPVLHQLYPNSGSSMADQVARIDERGKSIVVTLDGLREHIERTDEAFLRHLEHHAEAAR